MCTAYFLQPKTILLRIARWFLVLVSGFAFAATGHSQTLISGLGAGGTLRLFPTDLAVLESQQPRRDLSCAITAAKPELGFDFMFHTGYEIQVPIRELAGQENELTILFRVVPQDRPDDPSYMVQRVHVPELEEEQSKKAIKLYGNFTLGQGKYHVDWLMRDQLERFCAMSWDLETKLNAKDSQLTQWIPQALVQPPGQLFEEEPPIIRAPEGGLPRFSIIVNLDPPDPSAATIDDGVLYSLVSILRRMGRDSRAELHSIIVCSFGTQQVIYQQEDGDSIDLPALGKSLESLKLGLVDVKQLKSTRGPAQFATDLVREQLSRGDLDALVLFGPKAGWETAVTRDALESLDELDIPTFYLSYNAERKWNLMPDSVSRIIKRLRGLEYGINQPKDFFNAWSDVVSRILRAKRAPQSPMGTKSFIP